jgi:hypothetical protein
MKVDIELQTKSYVIRDINPDDNWDAGDYGLEVTGVLLRRTDREYADEIDGQRGDSAVVLIEHYSDGSTFGSNEYANVKGIFKTEDEARAHAATIDTDHGYFGGHIAFLYFNVVLP